jgi:hypothetical protein
MTLHRAAAVAALSLSLCACGGGGGGGIQTGAPVTPAPVTPAPVTPAPVTPAPVTPAVTISIKGPASSGVNGQSLVYNFSGNPPPIGTSFSFRGPAVQSTSTGVAGFDNPDNAITAILRSTVSVGGVTYPVFDISIPSLGATATNVRGDGTDATATNGGKMSTALYTLNYTILGTWSYTAPGGTVYVGQFANGSQTPLASLPTSGTATYTGTSTSGGVIGGYLVPGGNNTITGGTVTGDVNMNVNFGTNAVNGQLTNMTAKPITGGSVPWNNVTLNGNISRSSGGSFGGSASANPAPAGAGSVGLGTAAQGNFSGNFFGPAHNEIGGTWTLSESTPDGGRTAFGTFAGTR